jgi:hypothetical protein
MCARIAAASAGLSAPRVCAPADTLAAAAIAVTRQLASVVVSFMAALYASCGAMIRTMPPAAEWLQRAAGDVMMAPP